VNRKTYTKIFLKQAGRAVTEENISVSMRVWWQNNRTKKEGGLRLTEQGLDFVRTTLDLAVYEVPFPIGFDLKPQVIFGQIYRLSIFSNRSFNNSTFGKKVF
jgi:hypothetical protein